MLSLVTGSYCGDLTTPALLVIWVNQLIRLTKLTKESVYFANLYDHRIKDDESLELEVNNQSHMVLRYTKSQVWANKLSSLCRLVCHKQGITQPA